MTRKISVKKTDRMILPSSIVNATIVGANSSMTMDAVAIVLTELAKEDDVMDNLEYEFRALDYIQLKGLTGKKAKDHAYENLKKAFWGDTEKKENDYGLSGVTFHVQREDGEKGKRESMLFIKSIQYNTDHGSVSIEVSEDFKKFYNKYKNNVKKPRVYLTLINFIKLNSRYAKKLYWMLKEFENTGYRCVEKNDFNLFRENLNILKSYNNNMVIDQIVAKAIKEINEKTDIIAQYNVFEQEVRGGHKKTGITFTIQSKVESISTDERFDKIRELFGKYFEEEKENLSDKTIQLWLNITGDVEIVCDYICMTNKKEVRDTAIGYISTLIKKKADVKKYPHHRASESKYDEFQKREVSQDEMSALEKQLLNLTK